MSIARFTSFLAGLLLLVAAGVRGQSSPAPVLLLNPSFEDEPWHSKPPGGWFFCGPPGESPPDVHPSGLFAVETPPAHGRTYVGMVVRDNGTWEALGQHLEQPLLAGQCYRFSLQAMRSPHYRSISRQTGLRVEYTGPVRIRLWGGRFNCDHAELLAVSEPVADTSWMTVVFDLQPRHTQHFLIIEAYYPTEDTTGYLGNILLDHCSPLLPVDCTDGRLLAHCSPLHFPPPADHNALDQLVRDIAPGIRFGNGSAELHNDFFCDAEGRPLQQNAGLYRLAQALTAFPDVELVISLRSPGKDLTQQRILRLQQQLFDLGLEPHQFDVLPFRKRDLKDVWLGKNAEGEVWVRLQ